MSFFSSLCPNCNIRGDKEALRSARTFKDTQRASLRRVPDIALKIAPAKCEPSSAEQIPVLPPQQAAS